MSPAGAQRHVEVSEENDFPRGFGVNVVGFVTSRTGLGVASRITIGALVGAGVPVATVDFPLHHGRSGGDLTYSHLELRRVASLPSPLTRLPYPVTLIHMNPVEAALVGRLYRRWFKRELTLSVPFWELSELPRQWIPPLSRYDAVLAPTTHIADAVKRDVVVPIRSFPIAADVPRFEPVARSEFGIPQDRIAFVASWDTDSGHERKGGLLALRAFEMVLDRGVDATLVIKLNGYRQPEELEAVVSRLPSGRVVIVREYLPYARVLGLYAACDAFVSLHRAEGLGLGLQEAMLLGIPVIATGWSGNMDFMDSTSAALVDFRLTPVVDNLPHYSPERFDRPQFWADPNLADAADQMERLATDAVLRADLGAAAQARVTDYRQTFVRTAPRILADLLRAHRAA